MAMPAFTHHRDFSNAGFQAHSGVLDGGRCQWSYNNAFYWNPSLLDNATYELEFTINNPNAQDAEVTLARSDSYSVTLVELAPLVTIPAGSGQKTYRTPVTFPVDSHYTQWELYVLVARNAVGEANCEAPTVGGGIKATMSRLKIHQAAGWENTVVTRPMVDCFEGDANCFYCQTDLLNCSLNVPCYPLNAGLWERLDADFSAASIEYRLQSVIGTSASLDIFKQGTVTGLWNVSQAARVLDSLDGRFPNKFTDTPQFDFISKTVGADPQFLDTELYRWYWYVDANPTGDQSKLFGADLYIILTTATKVTTWARVSKGTGTSTNGFPVTQATARVLADDFENADELFIEVSGLTESGVTGRMALLDSGAVDDGTSGTEIADTVVLVDSLTQAVYRSAPFLPAALPAGARLLSASSLETGSGADFRADWHLIGARYEDAEPPVVLTCPPSVTIDLVCKTMVISMVCKAVVIEMAACKSMTISCCIPS